MSFSNELMRAKCDAASKGTLSKNGLFLESFRVNSLSLCEQFYARNRCEMEANRAKV